MIRKVLFLFIALYVFSAFGEQGRVLIVTGKIQKTKVGGTNEMCALTLFEYKNVTYLFEGRIPEEGHSSWFGFMKQWIDEHPGVIFEDPAVIQSIANSKIQDLVEGTTNLSVDINNYSSADDLSKVMVRKKLKITSNSEKIIMDLFLKSRIPVNKNPKEANEKNLILKKHDIDCTCVLNWP